MFGRQKSREANGASAATRHRDLLSVSEELPGLASELTEVLRMDWRRSTGDESSKDRLQSVCFRYGQRLGEINLSPSRALARMESEIDSLRDESVRTSHGRLASIGSLAWSLLHHEIPSLVRSREQLETELAAAQVEASSLRQQKPFYWHRLAFFIVPAIALLAAELAMGEEITRTALRLSGKLWWLFMAALLALPLIFKQLLEWKAHDRFSRGYLVALLSLVVVALFPLSYLRSEQAMRLVLRTRGSASASSTNNPFATPSANPPIEAARGGDRASPDPFAPMVGGGTDDPFAPSPALDGTGEVAGGDDPFTDTFSGSVTPSGTPQTDRTSNTPTGPSDVAARGTGSGRRTWPLTLTFLMLGLVFPMLSGLAFAKTLEQADTYYEGRRLRARIQAAQKELAAIQTSFKLSQTQLANHQAEILSLVEGLGDSNDFADKIIGDLMTSLGQLENDASADLLSRIEQLRDLGLKEMSKRLSREVGGLKIHGDMVLATQIKYYADLIGGIAQIDGGKSLAKLAQSRKGTLRTTLLDGYEAGRAAAFALLRSYPPEEKLEMVENRRFHDALFRELGEGHDSGQGTGGKQ